MARTILVCGYGPGISEGVARKFGAQGFQVALVARNEERLQMSARALGEAGITAKGFACDLGDAAAVAALIEQVRSTLGSITVLHWNAYTGGAGDLTTAEVAELHKTFDVSVTGLMVAVQKALPDLRAQKDSAVLVTGGGLAFYDPSVDTMATQWNAMGLAIAKAAQHKLVGLLHQKLKGDGVYVGEVVVLGAVKGTAFDQGNATLEASAIADRFWQIYQGRTESTVNFAG
jgi:NADP-dependent 3-hydroxy acid dehydrogenase YdfG